MQEIVDESPALHLVPESQHIPGQENKLTQSRFIITFQQVWLSKPNVSEADSSTSQLLPNEARLRNLTYSAPLYVDIQKTTLSLNEETGVSHKNNITHLKLTYSYFYRLIKYYF